MVNLSRFCGREGGFALLDVLNALFVFALGFGAIYGLSAAALQETHEAVVLNQAANVAQSTLDSLAAVPWAENLATGACVPGGSVEGSTGRFSWKLTSDWYTSPNLLRVTVEVSWVERGKSRTYTLESVYYTQ